MKKTGYLLIGILVMSGFGVFGFMVGESFQKSTADNELKNEAAFEQSRTTVIDSTQHVVNIQR